MKSFKNTPSQYYRLRRPEYFSDSEINYKVELPREQLAFELSQITTNQKQDEFETLCRRLAEKTIAPNLIPQVGPTGGGDGKTDSDSYPVSTDISNRWFVPENGWEKDEKWAFAFSAKETWKSKVEQDVKKIVGTQRGYTKVFFITNQTPSSKKKKDAQDDLINKYNVDVVILDGTWILEKIFSNNYFDLVVDSLNLSEVYKSKQTVVGKNDAERNKLLGELEEKIQNPNRYSEYDFQLVEDAIDAAILSRKLEKPRDEIEGKFDRAFRLCKKLNREKQWIRIYYQRAWTYLYYFDDFIAFVNDFKEFKKYISKSSSITEIELYVNLMNSLRAVCDKCDQMSTIDVNYAKEQEELYEILDVFSKKADKPCSSLIAKIFKTLQFLMDAISEEVSPDDCLKDLIHLFLESDGLIDFPFDTFKFTIEELGIFFPDNEEYDNLIIAIASIAEKRSSELTAGHTFLKRAIQKFSSKQYKACIIYFGKSVLKLAKEESNEGLYLALKGLGYAFYEMGLPFASNNCFVSASSIVFKLWYEEGILDSRVYSCAKQLAINEQIIGRLPSFFSWYELFNVISGQLNLEDDKDEVPTLELFDACLSVRILNSGSNSDDLFAYLPDVFENNGLWLAQNATFYKLGYTDLIINDYEASDIKNEEDLANYFELVAGQPFREQMLYDTNLCIGDEIEITSKVLGCKFIYSFNKDKELMLAAETLAAFFESFLATSLKDVFPSTEVIKIKLLRNKNQDLFSFKYLDSSEYLFEIDKFSFSNKNREELWLRMLEFVGNILDKNFLIKDSKDLLVKLFKDEELNERLAIVFEHRNFAINVLGDDPKFFFSDWDNKGKIKKYTSKRELPLRYNFSGSEKLDETIIEPDFDLNKIRHNQRSVSSIIDVNLWDKAKWNGFGFFVDRNGLNIFIGYKHGEEGVKIFKGWIKKFGTVDSEEKIKITIIIGVDKNNPCWYRVHIGTALKKGDMKSGEVLVSATRFHEMNAYSSDNLNNLISAYEYFKSFRFCPAEIQLNVNEINPFQDYSILKHEITIRNAWEIGLNDLESSAIKKGDNPIIPENVKNAPVLEVLRRR